MTQGKRLFLVCKTLLLPFTDPGFGQEDPLLQKGSLYAKFLSGEGQESKLYRNYSDVRKRLLDSLQQDVPPERLDELSQLLEMFYGNRLLSNALHGAGQSPFPLDALYLSRIHEISDSFLTLRDGRPALRVGHEGSRKDLFPGYTSMNKAELWNMLLRESTPDLWIAGYYASIDIHSVDALQNVPDEPVLADRVLMRRLSQGIADTHLHFQAGLNYQIQWELVTDVTAIRWEDRDRVRAGEELARVLQAGLLRLFLADYVHFHADSRLDFPEHYKYLPSSIHNILKNAVFLSHPDACIQFLKNYEICMTQLFDVFPALRPGADPAPPSSDLLGRTVYAKQVRRNTSSDILLFFEALRLACRPEKTGFRRALLQYIRIKNAFFQSSTQAETVHGLQKFREYYGHAVSRVFAFRRPGKPMERDSRLISQSVFRSYCRQPYIRLLEAKIAPPVVSPHGISDDPIKKAVYKNKIRRQLHDLFGAYHDLLTALAKSSNLPGEEIPQTLDRLQREQTVSIPTFGVIYHFIKTDQQRKLYRQVCWADGTPDKAENPFYTETLRKCSNFFSDMLTEMFQEVPHLAEYVVGLDAASDELYNEPWVYAPIFRYARRKGNTFPPQRNTHTEIPNLGLTYHVGEEFRALLSGLRAIDEVIEHFGYKTGDRLGHALALQVDPRLWQQNNEIIIQPQAEYLENLLWVWYVKSQFPSESFAVAIPDLEYKIMETAATLYPRSESLSPYLLWRGYQLKFQPIDYGKVQALCEGCAPCQYYQQLRQNTCNKLYADSTRICRLAADQPAFVWTEYDLLLTHFCPLYAERFSTPRFAAVSPAEVPMLIELQKYVKHKIEQRGITVEVNPTSNASIGEIPHLFAHPLLRLNNRGLEKLGQDVNHMSVSINTDDPLVFRTTIENEISYLYYMLMDMGYSQTDVLDWIDQIRKFSFDSRFICREKKASVQYQELANLIAALNRPF